MSRSLWILMLTFVTLVASQRVGNSLKDRGKFFLVSLRKPKTKQNARTRKMSNYQDSSRQQSNANCDIPFKSTGNYCNRELDQCLCISWHFVKKIVIMHRKSHTVATNTIKLSKIMSYDCHFWSVIFFSTQVFYATRLCHFHLIVSVCEFKASSLHAQTTQSSLFVCRKCCISIFGRVKNQLDLFQMCCDRHICVCGRPYVGICESLSMADCYSIANWATDIVKESLWWWLRERRRKNRRCIGT